MKAVFTFGRMNPPTIGHQKLVKKLVSVAKANRAKPFLYLSQTQNSKKDPLSYSDKIRFAKKSFPEVEAVNTSARTIIEVLKELEKKGFTDLTLVVGSDRVREFQTLINKYNGKEYNFDSINVVSAGARDPDAEGVEGMSASKLRQLAVSGLEDQFKTGLPEKLSDTDKKKIYNLVRKGLNVSEELEEKVLTLQQRMKKARTMKRLAPRFARLRKIKAKRMADPKRLLQRARKQAINIMRKRMAGERGGQYANLSPAAKISIDQLIDKKRPVIDKLAKRLLPKVRKSEVERLKKARTPKNEATEVPQDQDVKQRAGSQPAKYYKGLAKSTKKARDTHFDKYEKKPDDDPSAYKPAPGDKRAKTKPSVHTKKYKQMFGEGMPDQTDDVQDIVPGMMTVSRISSSYKKKLNAEFEKLDEISYASRTKERHAAERERLRDTHRREKEQMKQRHARAVDRAQVRDVRSEEYFEEGVNDPSIFKAVFLAGGPGSGKSFIIGQTALIPLGFKLINSDPAFERALEKAGLDKGKPEDIYSPQGQAARGRAKALTSKQMKLAIDGRLGLVIDGTGKDASKIKTQANKLKKLGYEVAMIFVNTDLETAQARNMKRDRTLPADEVESMWNEVQSNLGTFQSMFGKNMFIIDNSEDSDYAGQSRKVYNKIKTWAATEPRMPQAKAWINARKSVNEEFESLMINESFEEQLRQQKGRSSIVPRDNYTLEEKSIAGLKKKSEKSGVPYSILKKVYDRGMAAWKTGHRPGTTPQQWAFARVNSFLTGGKTRTTADKDLWAKASAAKKSKKESMRVGPYMSKVSEEVQSLDESFQIAFETGAGMGETHFAKDLGIQFERGYQDHPSITEDWFSKLMNKYLLKPRTYQTAKQILRQVLDRKKKEGQLKHSIEYYAQRIAQNFKGVDARELAKMVTEEHGAGEEGTDELVKKYVKDTPHMEIQREEEDWEEFEAICEDCMVDLPLVESEYEGKKVTLNDPIRSSKGPKKFHVFVKNDKGNVVKVNFGDPNLSIKRDDPDRRRSFRARHNCDNPGPKWKPRYWSCRMWTKGKKVSDLD